MKENVPMLSIATFCATNATPHIKAVKTSNEFAIRRFFNIALSRLYLSDGGFAEVFTVVLNGRLYCLLGEHGAVELCGRQSLERFDNGGV